MVEKACYEKNQQFVIIRCGNVRYEFVASIQLKFCPLSIGLSVIYPSHLIGCYSDGCPGYQCRTPSTSNTFALTPAFVLDRRNGKRYNTPRFSVGRKMRSPAFISNYPTRLSVENDKKQHTGCAVSAQSWLHAGPASGTLARHVASSGSSFLR